MIAKLTKYEFKSCIKFMGLIWGALIVSSILLSVVSMIQEPIAHSSFFVNLFQMITTFIYAALIGAMVIFNLIFIIQRFYKSLLDDEGYLMNTLPVRMWHLITSKGIVATCLLILSGIATTISILIIGRLNIFEFAGQAFSEVAKTPVLIVIAIECIIIIIMGLLKSVYQVYASIAIGQLFNRHRVIASVGAYMAISLALTIITSVFLLAGDGTFFENVYIDFSTLNELTILHLGALAIFLVEAVQLVAFHVIAERLLSKKLNLL